MESKTSLKLKLKLGNRGTTSPETLSPKPPTEENRMADEDIDPMMSDDDAEFGEEWQEDQQGDNFAEEDEEAQNSQQYISQEDGARERHKKSKKKKKKKEKEKERHKHKHRERTELDEDEPSAKKIMTHYPTQHDRASSMASQTAFKELIEVLLQRLQNKDSQHFFSFPVTDLIAPGYSSVITQPMDFAKMQQKVQEGAYNRLSEFRNDLHLICNNCMIYNQPDTIFYKTAKKLLHAGDKVLSTSRVLPLKNELPNMLFLTFDQLGFDINVEIPSADLDEVSQDSNKSSDNENSQDGSNKLDSPEEGMSASDILEQAQAAAEDAAEKLTMKKPECTLGFLRQRKDGTTTLNFLTGCEGNDANLKEKPISLGLLTGKLTQGSSTLHNYRDDKRSMAKPVKSLYYGTFSSFCPSYDSTFANLNKEESEMVYSTYGNETAVQYAESICDFSRDCDMAMHLVDQLLNLLTHQQHSRTKSFIEERRRIQQEEQKIHSMLFSSQEDPGLCKQNREVTPNFTALKTLKDIGIDTSFLSTFEKLEQREKIVGSKLSENATLLASLAKEQKERLSKPLPPNLNSLPPPSQNEIRLAEKVTEGLISVARQIPPGALAPVPIVRRALGITMMPVTSEALEQVDVDIEETSPQEVTTPERKTCRPEICYTGELGGSEAKLDYPHTFQGNPHDSGLPSPHSTNAENVTDKKLKEILGSS